MKTSTYILAHTKRAYRIFVLLRVDRRQVVREFSVLGVYSTVHTVVQYSVWNRNAECRVRRAHRSSIERMGRSTTTRALLQRTL